MKTQLCEILLSMKEEIERDENGGVGGHEAHLPVETHQKYIYMWNNSHKKLTRNWQNSYTHKAGRKIST